MHPTTSYQIANLQAAELQRRVDLRSAHAATPRPARDRTVRPRVRRSLQPVWSMITGFRSA